jgi:pimeloyl-ACP methyl ester carboxylesterase
MREQSMARFVLVPGAGGEAWTWHLLVEELEARGHEAIAVDILEDDPKLGLEEFAQQVLDAVAGDPETVLVALSLGAFTAPVVAERTTLRALVLLNPMIPIPGETPGQWWAATGQPEARVAADRTAGRDTEFTLHTHFFHDLPDALRQAAGNGGRGPSDTPFGQPCEFTEWPSIPLKVIVGRDDRLFPVEFQQRVVAERLDMTPEVMSGGHLLALSRPAELADRLESFLAEAPTPGE